MAKSKVINEFENKVVEDADPTRVLQSYGMLRVTAFCNKFCFYNNSQFSRNRSSNCNSCKEFENGMSEMMNDK